MNRQEDRRSIVLTGANRGLGLEFARKWVEAGNGVFALARNPDEAPDLLRLRDDNPDCLNVLPCDIADDASVQSAATTIGKAWDSVDILLNNAGVYGQRGVSVSEMDFDDARRVFEINSLGPLRMTRAVLPLLRRGKEPRVVHMTSLMGSISDNTSGGSYAYRMSKTALNMASRNLAHEFGSAGIISAVIHPGWVQTDMGGGGAPLTIEESVASMIRSIEGFRTEHSGAFFDRDGQRLEW